MPRKAMKPCKHPGCPRLTEGAYCDEHKPLHPERPSAAKRGYGSKWQRVSKAYLRKHPLCVKCLADGELLSGRRALKKTCGTVFASRCMHKGKPFHNGSFVQISTNLGGFL